MNTKQSVNHSNMSKKSLWYWGLLGYIAIIPISFYYGVRMLFSQKYRQGLRQRLTLYNQNELDRLKNGPYVWVHTVSLGELQAARPLLFRLRQEHPQYQTLVSTVTETGQTQARSIPEVDTAVYLPLDLYPLCHRTLSHVKPVCLIILETEIWPNLIRAAVSLNIPLFLVNARLSDRSFMNYYRTRALFAPLLRQFQAILTQSESDRERFLKLGTPEERVQNMGNIKFESVSLKNDPAEREHWRSLFEIKENEILLLGGSTFPGEEMILVRTAAKLYMHDVPLRLLIAPRHIDRVPAIVAEMKEQNVNVIKRSEIEHKKSIHFSDILLLDTTGELSRVYAAADIVFIGKSLTERGGQNPIEPAAWGKPVLFGPNMQNFRDVSALFLLAGAAQVVNDENELYQACLRLCQSPEERQQLGTRAQDVVRQNQGALDHIMQNLTPFLHPVENV